MVESASAATATYVHRLNLNVVGGVEVTFAQYARHRQSLGAGDTVIIGDGVAPRFTPAVAAPMRAISRREFKRWHGLRLPKFARLARARIGARLVAGRGEKALVGWDSIGNREILDIARIAGLPLLHYEHGQAWRPEVHHAGAFFARADGVIANSFAAERMLALRWGWQGPTARVYCCVDEVLDDRAVRHQCPVEGPIWLGSAARMVEVKGHRIAVHALKLLRDDYGVDARLAIAGSGEGEAELHAEVERLGLTGVVSFKGSVDNMGRFYDAIDIMLVPSLLEPFGRTSIEAQARGCPVIVTAVDGLPETLGPATPSAAIVRPEWSLAEYEQELGGDAQSVWPWVYDPQADDLCLPRAIAPDRLAAAVMALTASDAVYRQASAAGLENARARFHARDYGPAVDTAITTLLAPGQAR